MSPFANALVERFVPARLGRSYRWLLTSSWTTNLGDGLAIAAGPLLMASLTDSPMLISLAALMAWAPRLLFSLYAGVLADRLDRRRIILAANATRAVALSALVVLVATGRVSTTTVLVALGLLATAEVFADNTTATLAPMLVHRDDLALANSRTYAGFITLNQLVGPPIGAALFALGSAWPFAAQALLVLAGVLQVTRIVLPAHGRDRGTARRSVRHDVAEGLKWTVGNAAVRTLILTILIFNVTFGAAWSVLVLYADRQLGLGAVGFGAIATVGAVGGLLGTGLYGAITRRMSLGNIMRIGLIIETLTHFGLAVTTVPWIAFVIFFVFGAHAFVWGTTSMTIRQRAVPTELQGRVTSLNMLGSYAGVVVGSVAGGVLATQFGITAPFWFAFGGSAIFVALIWRQLSHVAHADQAPAQPEEPVHAA